MTATLNDLQRLDTLLNGAPVALGVYGNAARLGKFGAGDEIPTTFATVWPDNTLKVYRDTQATMSIASTDPNDTDGGSGARTAAVFGVDGNWDPVRQTVTLNGQTPVVLPEQMMICFRVIVLESGASDVNEGILYVGTGTFTGGVPANKECIAPANEGQSESAFYPVPRGATLMLASLRVSAVAAGKEIEVRLRIRPLGGSWNVKQKNRIVAETIVTPLIPPMAIPERTVVEMIAKVDATTAWVAASFSGVVVAPQSVIDEL